MGCGAEPLHDPVQQQQSECPRRCLCAQGKEVDFFLAVEPAWLEKRFPEQAKRVRRPAVALLCPDKNWML